MSNAVRATRGRTVVSETPASAPANALGPGVDERHQSGQHIFGPMAPVLVSRGWSVFPQNRGDRRGPGLVDGKALLWKEFGTRLPTLKEVEWWGVHCPRHNVACIMGPASGDVFGIDIDVSDPEFSRTIVALAKEHLGESPYRRVGRHPRMVLLYRQAPESEQSEAERIPSRSFRFVQQDANGDVVRSDDGIEVLSRGKPITFYGLHHKTGQWFDWMGLHPSRHGPEHAPLVTQEQVVTFLEAVQEVRRFHRNTASTAVDLSWTYDEKAGLNIPRLATLDGSDWVEDANGIVTDGREAYLFRLVGRTVWSNEAAARDRSGKGFEQLCAIVFNQFKSRAKMSDKWDESYLRSQVRDKVARQVRDSVDNDRFMRTAKPVVTHKATVPERAAPAPNGDDLAYLPNAANVVRTTFKVGGRKALNAVLSPVVESRKAERALVSDRTQIAASVAENITKALDAFFGEVYAAGKRNNRIHLLKAPTGAGKTSRTIAYIAEDPRTKMYDREDGAPDADAEEEGEEAGKGGPLLMLLPTYNNIEELRLRAEVLNLDKGLSDDELATQARERNLFSEDEIEARMSDMRREAMNAGLRTMIYRGKANAGCMFKDKLALLTQAGIGSAGLCKASVKNDDDEVEEKLCPHYAECPAIQQRKEISRSHVVFMPHAFLTLSHPEEMSLPRGVIADERVFHLFLHTTTFQLGTLKRERREPRLSKKEKELKVNPQEFLAERNLVADIAYNAIITRECPAERISNFRRKNKDGTVVLGADLVASAKRVCSHAISSSQGINPDMTLDEVRTVCESPTGTEVREELRFWNIIEDRIALLNDPEHSLAKSAAENGHPEQLAAFPAKAKGRKEMRIQLLLGEGESEGSRSEKVRISWRSKPNWDGAPLLLLDASADEDITRKIFNGRTVVVHDVPAALNVRTVAVIDATYANASIVQRGPAQAHERLAAAKVKDKFRKVISAVSAYYGWGRVVVGSNVIVRRAINSQWAAPSNVDFCHYGAMRGLDFAKNHVAALSFGRMEVPVRSIDGIVAALTYDDDEPEHPHDRNGDGIDHETGEELRVPMTDHVLKHRDGFDVAYQIPVYPGKWARAVQRQYREEELKQFLGRLRPVYRTGEAPVWIAVSKVVPDDVIVDDVISLDDLVRPGRSTLRIWDACRLSGGVIHPELFPVAAPNLYRDAEDAAKDIKAMKFPEDANESSRDEPAGGWHRNLLGFTPVTVKDPDGTGSVAFVRSDEKDPSEVAAAAFERLLGWDRETLDPEPGTPFKERRQGVRRTDDWLDGDLGTPEQRASDEAMLRQAVAEEAVRTLPAEAFARYGGQVGGNLPVQVKVPVLGRAVEMPMTFDDLLSDKSNAMMHARLLTGHADVEGSPVFEGGDLYDHLDGGESDTNE